MCEPHFVPQNVRLRVKTPVGVGLPLPHLGPCIDCIEDGRSYCDVIHLFLKHGFAASTNVFTKGRGLTGEIGGKLL